MKCSDCGDDAMKWTELFKNLNPESDEGEMLSWFANVIEISYEARVARERLARRPSLSVIPPGWFDSDQEKPDDKVRKYVVQVGQDGVKSMFIAHYSDEAKTWVPISGNHKVINLIDRTYWSNCP